jgi:hypothetical protein
VLWYMLMSYELSGSMLNWYDVRVVGGKML